MGFITFPCPDTSGTIKMVGLSLDNPDIVQYILCMRALDFILYILDAFFYLYLFFHNHSRLQFTHVEEYISIMYLLTRQVHNHSEKI